MNTFIKVKKKDILKYNKWINHLNNAKERTNYAIRRMDLLIISICGAGIYIVFETFKSIALDHLIVTDPTTLKLSGIFFLIAITINFVSQQTGFYANNEEQKYSILEISKIEGNKIDECQQRIHDKNVNIYNLATRMLNIASITLMFAGLILLAYFNYHLF